MSTTYVPALGLLPVGFGLGPEVQAAIAAVSAGSGGSLSPDVVQRIARSAPSSAPYPKFGRYYSAPYDTLTPTAVVKDRLYWVPIYIPYGAQMNNVGFKVTTAAAGAAKISLHPAGSMGQPMQALGVTAPLDTSTVGDKEGALVWFNPTFDPENQDGPPPNYVEPGLYFLGIVFSGTPTINWHSSTSDGAWRQSAYGATASDSTVAPYHQYSGQTYAAALPEFYGVSTDGTLQKEPHVWWRM
uniref:Uncharacterized protein n=1 Tax=Pseudomonas phage Cygsa01 TaxID=3138529 RepID=A0AAU6W3F6_9VIRU